MGSETRTGRQPRRLVVGTVFDTRYGGTRDIDLQVLSDLHIDHVIFEVRDHAVDAAAGDDLVPLLELVHPLLLCLLLLDLRSQDQQPEYDEHQHEGQQLGDGTARSLPLGSATHGVGGLNEEEQHDQSVLFSGDSWRTWRM